MKINWRILLVLLVFVGCNRWDNIVDNPNGAAGTTTELEIGSDFDWQTSLNVAFYIKNASIGIITISSEDETVIFHKGYYNGQIDTYHIIVNLPYYMESIRINGELVPIDSNIIVYTLGETTKNLKAFKASASSLSFNGETNYVDVDREIISKYPFTLSAWIKTNGFSDEDEDMVIVSLANPSKKDQYFGIFIGEDENGKACIRARKGPEKTVNGTVVLTDGEWHQIVGVYSSKNNRKLYVDGELEASDNRKVDFPKDVDLLTMGRWGDQTPMSYFNGNIDEVQIWNKALSAEEISEYYSTAPSGEENNLKAYYKLNEGEGNSIVDEISGNSEGELNGVSWSSDGVDDSGNGSGDEDDTDGDSIKDVDDDFPQDATKAFINYFPATGYGTLAFEDLWPASGDYDFNDLVIDYQFRTITNSENFIAEIQADFIIRAIGASFKNGFGFQFPNTNIDNDDITVSGYNIENDYITLSETGIEASQNKPTVIVFDNAFDLMPRIGGEMGINTDPEASVTLPDTVKIIMSLRQNQYLENEISISRFNPFIMVEMTRGKEIHLPNYTPTTLADDLYFNMLHDDSNQNIGRYYKTEDNLPWAINLYQSFDYPSEKNQILGAFLKFEAWAESDGVEFPDWYLDKEGYRNDDNIY